jgi:hypothetical protein
MTLSVKSLTAVAAVTLGGAAFVPAGSADAQVFYGRPIYQGGYVRYAPGAPAFGPRAGFYGGPRYGWGGGYRPGFWGARSGWGGYRPGFWGPRYGWGGGFRSGYWGPRYGWGGGYYRGYDNGGAVAAGLIGGLALGAVINAATRPAYYAPPVYRAYNNCFFERRRVVTRNGNAVIRRVRTCY